MVVLDVCVDDSLEQRLEEVAKRKGITVKALIRQLLEEALGEQPSQESCSRKGREPLLDVVDALRKGRKPRVPVDWSRIEGELAQTAPQFSTVEEALNASRARCPHP